MNKWEMYVDEIPLVFSRDDQKPKRSNALWKRQFATSVRLQKVDAKDRDKKGDIIQLESTEKSKESYKAQEAPSDQ